MANKPYALVPFKYLEDNFIKKGTDTSWVGYRITDESLDSQEKVIEKLGGTYWKLLSNSLDVYQWLRTDMPTPNTAYEGFKINLVRSVTSDYLSDTFGGVEWEKVGEDNGIYQWVCTDYSGGVEEELPAYVGMVVSSPNLPDAMSVQAIYGGTWVFLGDEDGVYQWYCSAHDSPADSMEAILGEVIASTSLTSVAQVETLYGGTWEMISDEDEIYQYVKLS